MRTILKRAPWLALLFVILLGLPAPVFCQSGESRTGQVPLSVDQYVSELDHCSAVLNDSAKNPAAYSELRQTLPPQWTVQAGAQNYTVNIDWLKNALTALPPTRRADNPLLLETQRHLASLREAAIGFNEPSSQRGLGNSRAQLERIMSAREFRAVQGPSWFDLWKARVYDWIWRQIDKLLKRIGISKSVGSVIAWVLIGAAVLLMIFWAVRAILGSASRSEIDLRGASRPAREWRDWLREARAAAERGDYRSAIHAAYWAGAGRLEEANVLPLDRSRTPRESLRLVRRESAEYGPLAQLTRHFELVWYGYRAATETEWSDALQQLEKLGCLPSSIPVIAAS